MRQRPLSEILAIEDELRNALERALKEYQNSPTEERLERRERCLELLRQFTQLVNPARGDRTAEPGRHAGQHRGQ